MKKHLQRILFLLAALALALGVMSALSESTEARIITITWSDGNDYDGYRPDAVTAKLAGQTATLNAANGWTDAVAVPAGTAGEWELSFENQGQYLIPSLAVSADNPVTVATLKHETTTWKTVYGEVTDWDDFSNDKNTRPKEVWLMLYADGEPYGEPLKATPSDWKVHWDKMPVRKPRSSDPIDYTVKPVQIPDGYTCSCSGTKVKFALQTTDVTVSVSVSGYPEGTDLSNLKLLVDGPDPDMPVWLSWEKVLGGSFTFTNVLPGAYMIRDTNADKLVEGYYMDADNSKVCDAKYVRPNEPATLEFKYTYKEPEAIDDLPEEYDPWANIGNLTIEVLGPDPKLPDMMPIHYSDFIDGKYELPDLQPGVYTVVERNAEKLVNYYYLTSDSVTALKLTITPDGKTEASVDSYLFDKYVPVPTPEPEAEFVDIPVTKTWNDNDDQDGNRPDSITVRLYADGVEVDSHVLTAAEGWTYTFKDLPRYKEDNKTEIVYSINEDNVVMYSKVINGYNIVNNYMPEETSRSVAKIWQDNNNAQKLRPTSIVMTLSNGERVVKRVVLSEENGWSATVNHLPTVINGKTAVYTWTEQEIVSYKLIKKEEKDGRTVFTNGIPTRETDKPGKTPKGPGDTTRIEDYKTPLGVEIMINHVGDCFD